VRFERIFANACDEVRFSPDGRRLAFLLRDPDAWERMAVRFIDLRSRRLEKGAILFEGIGLGGSLYGRKMKRPHFRFLDGGRLVALYSAPDKNIRCFDARTLERRTVPKGCAPPFAAAKAHPWIFDARGRLCRCGDGRTLFSLNLPRDILHEILQAEFFRATGTCWRWTAWDASTASIRHRELFAKANAVRKTGAASFSSHPTKGGPRRFRRCRGADSSASAL